MNADNPRPWKKDVTKGEWKVRKYNRELTVSKFKPVDVLRGDHALRISANTEGDSDAELIAEAGTVFHQTGMTPGELAERVAALAAQVEELEQYVRGLLGDR